MKFVELSEKQFKKFADTNSQISFHQTIEWGQLKENNGWNMSLVGLVDNKNCVKAAALLLSKSIPIIRKKMFYSPRGFLIDYNNLELLEEFTKEIKKYIKKNNGIFIKIDPYVSYQERDLLGNVVSEGKNNKKAYNNLIKLGYKHFGFNLMQNTLQPRWIFVTDVKGKSIDEIMSNMDPKTRQILRKNEKDKIKCREIKYDELPLFKDIMQHTGDRRDFIDRPLKYYQDMYNCLHKSNILKILVAELNTTELIDSITKEIDSLNKEYEEKEFKYKKNPTKMNKDKYEKKQEEIKKNILRLKTKKEKIKKLRKENGEIIPLGGILFLIYGNEVLSLLGGSYAKFMEFQSAYTVHFEGLKYALNNGYDRYNFYGITGDFSEKNPLFGLYSFKRDFGGKVVELIGEFDLVINKFYYLIYKIVFSLYRFVKKFVFKLKRKKT